MGRRRMAKVTEFLCRKCRFCGYHLSLRVEKKVRTCVLTVDLCRAEGKFGKKVVGVEQVLVASSEPMEENEKVTHAKRATQYTYIPLPSRTRVRGPSEDQFTGPMGIGLGSSEEWGRDLDLEVNSLCGPRHKKEEKGLEEST